MTSRPSSPARTEILDVARPAAISVFMPAHNEALNLEASVGDVVWAAQQCVQDLEILVVDDGSTDGTGELAERLAQNDARMKVIHNPGKRGIAFSYHAALEEATKPYFAFLPADREVNATSIREIFRAVGTADIIIPYHANRQARAWYRRLLTWVSTGLLNALFHQHLRYYQGPAIYPTALARRLPSTTKGFFFLTEMLVHALRGGYSYAEVGLIHQERAYGRSKALSLSNILAAVETIASLWWSVYVVKTPSEMLVETRPKR